MVRISLCLLVLLTHASGELVISEFLSRNETGLRDEDGERSDWIEIANLGSSAVNLDGWTLTDNSKRPKKWNFPAGELAPGGRRLVFASKKNRRAQSGEWHSNFRLSATGEYLAIVMPGGKKIAHAIEAAPQFDDIAYGVDGVTREVGYLDRMTPGDSNGRLIYPGPVISKANHAPELLKSGSPGVVTARVDSRQAKVATVLLHSVVDYGQIEHTEMRDDGEGDDRQAGDGFFTGVIAPQSRAKIEPGRMLRWFITATDENGAESRLPAYLDREGVEQSPEYFGTVVKGLAAASEMPVFEWFTQDERNSRRRSGARASVFFLGRFYDNVFVRQRGGAINLRSQKFNFSNAFPVYVNKKLPDVVELNLNARGWDSSYLRQSLAFEAYRWMGNAACESFPLLMRLNGMRDRIGILIEQVDEDFLDRHGYDGSGDLYKFVQRRNLEPVFADAETGIEKKTGNPDDFSSVQSLVDGLHREKGELRAFLFDALNMPQVLTYLAVRSVIQETDDVRKNFYLHYDTRGTREWSIFPWDNDGTLGVRGQGGRHLNHPFFGDKARWNTNHNQWNRLYEAVFNDPITRQMYLRRLRTVMDEILQPVDTPEAKLRFERRVDEMFAVAKGDVPSNAATSVKRFFPKRRRDLYMTYSNWIPDSQAKTPRIEFGKIESNSKSESRLGNYVELLNLEDTAVDLSGWELAGDVTFTFKEGTVIASRQLVSSTSNRLYVVSDVNGFRSRAESPTGGEGRFVQGSYKGYLSGRGDTLILKDRDGRVITTRSKNGE